MSCRNPQKFFYHHNKSGFYANEIYACSEKEAKEQYKLEHNLKRLPNGFEIWKGS